MKAVALVHLISPSGLVMFTGVEYEGGRVSGSNGRDFTTGTLSQLVEAGKQFSARLERFTSMADYLAFMHTRMRGGSEVASHGKDSSSGKGVRFS